MDLESPSVSANGDYARKLLDNRMFSRIAAHDTSLFSFDPEVESFAGGFLGWTNLASKPPVNPGDIAAFAAKVRAEGLRSVVLIGQGGSTQASMTITKLNALVNTHVTFKTMDSVSPVYVNKILGEVDPTTTLYIVASKSGTTLEPTLLMRVTWEDVCSKIGPRAASKRFVAITDPGSELARHAEAQNWRAIFDGSPNVGGRFSALSVFGLLSAALVGIDIIEMLDIAAACERRCSTDSPDNPALKLAAFLYSNYASGRRMFSLVSPQPGRVFGLWVEQLVAESLGKDSKGILPNIEVDPNLLTIPRDDRCVITYAIRPDASFASDISRIDKTIPTLHFQIPDVMQIACHFIIWEYAVCACGVLMEVNPFDQPDVQLTKTRVKQLLYGQEALLGTTKGCYSVPTSSPLILEAEISPEATSGTPVSVDDALEQLFSNIEAGGFFSLNAFLPFHKEFRRIPLEAIRHSVAVHLDAVSCLEIGPRYLHSTGQLHKGGSDNGVFLILSSEEPSDVEVPGESFSLGTLAHAQACGDMAALAEKGRCVMRLHLAANDGHTLKRVAAHICAAACKVAAAR